MKTGVFLPATSVERPPLSVYAHSEEANPFDPYDYLRKALIWRSVVSEIRVHFDEELLPLLGDSPEEIERHALEMIVLGLYRRHAISAGRAAQIIGMEKYAFIRWTGEMGIPYLDMTREEWQEELRVLEKL